MLSYKKLKSNSSKTATGKNAGSSVYEYLANTEYWINKEGIKQSNSQWFGKGCEVLNLAGSVEKEELEQLLLGFSPASTKEKPLPLVNGAGDEHVMGDDATFSANKPVSLCFAFGDDQMKDNIRQKHDAAVNAALKFIEENAMTRLGAGGENHEHVAGLMIAKFQHYAARAVDDAIDPQLHTHALILNLAVSQDGKIRTLENRSYYDLKMVAGALYRAEMARGMQELGFEVELDGTDNFTIKGIDEQLVEDYSKRRQQIEADLKTRGAYSAKAAEQSALSTRQAKDEPPYEELVKRWEAEGKAIGMTPDFINRLARGENPLAEQRQQNLEHIQQYQQQLGGLNETRRQEREQDISAEQYYRLSQENKRRIASIHSGREDSTEGNSLRELSRIALVSDIKPSPMLLQSYESNHLESKVGRNDDVYGSGGTTPSADDDRKPKRLTHDELYKLITQQSVSFQEKDVLQLLATKQVGMFTVDELKQQTKEFLERQDVIAIGNGKLKRRLFTTQEIIDLEKQIQTCALDRMFDNRFKCDKNKAFDTVKRVEREQTLASGKDFSLNQEQLEAVEHLTQKLGGIGVVQGWAGAGKTTMVRTASEVFKDQGYQVIGCALAGKAADGLQEEANIDSSTIFSLLQELKKGEAFQAHVEAGKPVTKGMKQGITLTDKTVIVMDEAGMTGLRQMAELQKYADKAKAKLILIGDTKQLQPIDAGGPMRSLVKVAGAKELKSINRQVKAYAKQAVYDFADGKAQEALQAYYDKGLVEIKKNKEELIAKIIEDWKQDENEPTKKVIIAGTRAEVYQINKAARAELIAQGKIDTSTKVTVEIDKKMKQTREFALNDRIIFTRNNKVLGVKNGNLGFVREIFKDKNGKDMLKAELDNGKMVTIPLTKYKTLDWGNAITVHKSQGISINSVYVATSERMMDREWTYVAMSRSKLRTKLYTTEAEVEGLELKMSSSRQKENVVDITKGKTIEKAQAIANNQEVKRLNDEQRQEAVQKAALRLQQEEERKRQAEFKKQQQMKRKGMGFGR